MAGARIIEANANARVVGAALLPNVNLTGNASHSNPSTFDLGSGAGDSNIGSSGGGGAGSSGGGAGEFSFYSLALNASYVVDFWGRNRDLLRAAEFSAPASRFNREVVALTILVSIANFIVLEGQDLLDTARKNLKASEGILKLIQERFDSGTASALDVAQQASLVAITRASIPPIGATGRAKSRRPGGVPEHVNIRGGSMYRLGIPRVMPGLPSELLVRRPNVRKAEAKLAGADANVAAARAAFYTVASTLTYPIFDGGTLLGTLLGQLDLQKGTREELLQSYRKAVISTFTDVEKEWPHGARLIA